ncbi:MAG: ATP-binding protein, partial [Candidatus Paceibacterota bacterium]
MNNNQTIEKLKAMRLDAMAHLHHQHIRDNRWEAMTCDEYLALLTDHQWEDRENRKIDRLLKQAGFRQNANLADISYSPERNLDKNMFARLGTLDFIPKKEGLIICGASGVGKSYLAQALGHQACLSGYKTLYAVTARIFKKLKLCKVDGTYLKELEKLTRTDLLILDDFGLQAFDNQDRETLMDIIDDRHSRKSTIISS